MVSRTRRQKRNALTDWNSKTVPVTISMSGERALAHSLRQPGPGVDLFQPPLICLSRNRGFFVPREAILTRNLYFSMAWFYGKATDEMGEAARKSGKKLFEYQANQKGFTAFCTINP